MFLQPLQLLSAHIIEIADRELPPRCNCGGGERKADGSLVTEADLVMQTELNKVLRQYWPDVAVLGEEMTEAEQQAALRAAPSGVWCVDPLDGTSNFAAGIPYYAVSVALIKGDAVELAVVYDPSRRECFTAARGHGAWLNGQPLPDRPAPANLSRTIALVDFKRLPTRLASRLATQPPYRSQRSFGAVALDWCWLAAGRSHIYLHGRQQLWDYAAGWLILHEAGGQSTSLDGTAVFRSTLEPQSAVAARDPALYRQWRDWLEIPADATNPPPG